MKRIKGPRNTVIEVKGCCDCLGQVESCNGEGEYCALDLSFRCTGVYYDGGRPEWCPLVHGPLVVRLAKNT